jgi:hypothetical protein
MDWYLRTFSNCSIFWDTTLAMLVTCFHAGFLLHLYFDLENGWHVLPKRPWIFNELHGVISQKIELFITTAMRTSNPACAFLSIPAAFTFRRIQG